MKDDVIIKKFNIYCDESRVENQDSHFMVIGALLVPKFQKKSVSKDIKEMLASYNFFQELKWNKVGNKYSVLYKKIIDYFISKEELQYRCIIVDKSKVKYDVFHKNDTELAFFKFYYLMLRNRLADDNNYYIFLDKKPTRDKNRARSLNAFLNSYVLLHRKNCNIKHFQAYPSKNNVLIQLADFLTGLVAFRNNSSLRNSAKSLVSKYFEENTRISLIRTTSPHSKKINLLKWSPKI